jgi:hypothetical protein
MAKGAEKLIIDDLNSTGAEAPILSISNLTLAISN